MRNLSENFGLCPPLVETTSHGSRVTNHQYRSLVYLLVMGVFLTSASTPRSWGRYSGGTGEPNDPYRIVTPQDLNNIGNYEEDWDKHFILVNDVNLAQYTGRQFRIIGSFSGVFDGNDHKIWNFSWVFKKFFISHIGLFCVIGKDARIKNLGMENVDVNTAGWYIGALVGYNDGAITNCYATGKVRGSTSVGGLVGCNSGTITNCYSMGSISGSKSGGGLVGENESGTIRVCYSTADVMGGYAVGGLVGTNGECVYACDPSGGGCQGICWDGQIYNCYSMGSITGNRYVGGLIGYNWSGIIDTCYSISDVIGDEYVGGFIGYRHLGTVTDSFWDIDTSGLSESAGGTPKTTAEMKTMSTFTDAGWDFVEIWGIGENQTYPFLRTEPVGDSNHDKKVDLADLAILASHWLDGTTP